MSDKSKISGFAGYPQQVTQLINYERGMDPCPKMIARGNGLSYGDSAISPHCTISLLNNKACLHFDQDQGLLTCEAGILLSQIYKMIQPAGFKLFVVPGTLHITLGGAIAHDVHGKNHTTQGTFAHYLVECKLLIGERIVTCSPRHNVELFRNTIGGAGLTGIILEATLKLRKLGACSLKVKRQKFSSIRDLLQAFQASTHEYQMAWIKNPRQMIFTEANYTEQMTRPKTFKIKIDFHWWGLMTSKVAFGIVEWLRYNTHASGAFLIHELDFLHPLDRITGWNLLYTRGFIQFQFVVPSENALQAIEHTLEYCQQKKFITFLTTLKKFGSKESIGSLSFVKSGYAFSIDIKYRPGLEKELEIVANKIIEWDGRFYLAKDAFLNASQFKKCYPKSESFKAYIHDLCQGRYTSYLSHRLQLHVQNQI